MSELLFSNSVLPMDLSIRTEIETIDPSQVPLVVSDITIDQYFQVAISTALVYYSSEF